MHADAIGACLRAIAVTDTEGSADYADLEADLEAGRPLKGAEARRMAAVLEIVLTPGTRDSLSDRDEDLLFDVSHALDDYLAGLGPA